MVNGEAERFLGQSAVVWSGVEAIGVCLSTTIVLVTAWLVYWQVRAAARTFRLSAIQRLQELVDDFRDKRTELFHTFPLEIALGSAQFQFPPPGRLSARRPSDAMIERMQLTAEQKTALASLTEAQRALGRYIIGRLNDIGQLVEDGFVDKRMFLGKYHVMLIQCCHLLEAVRRGEEAERGGNYGQRLLRMRHWATVYNDVSPKHRAMPVGIRVGERHRVVYKSPNPSLWRKVGWASRRWLGLYG